MTAHGGELPPSVRGVIADRLNGLPRAGLQASAQRFSAAYRTGAHSGSVISNATDALAYAIVRMPATYAAVHRVLGELSRIDPSFAPSTSLDLGAGPGTATLAALAFWPDLSGVRLVEPNGELRALAQSFLADTAGTSIAAGDARHATTQAADLVMAGYVLAEQSEADAQRLVEAALASAHQYSVFVEPGTTHGFARLRAARTTIHAAGWHLLAPCPHANACPLPADDWCHFTTRLMRSREHRLVKGVDAPYEDEPYSYLIARRAPLVAKPPSRILRQPIVGKGDVAMKLCGANGLDAVSIPRRDKPAYKAAKNADAGDVWPT